MHFIFNNLYFFSFIFLTGTCVVQDLTVHVGHDTTQHISEKNMATICKLSRGHYMPPPFTSVQEWFHYAFACADIKGKLFLFLQYYFPMSEYTSFLKWWKTAFFQIKEGKKHFDNVTVKLVIYIANWHCTFSAVILL